MENLDDHASHTAGSIWESSNKNLYKLVDRDPNHALKFGLNLIYLPDVLGKNLSTLFPRWLQGNGLTILVQPKIHHLLNIYVRHCPVHFFDTLHHFLDFSIPDTITAGRDLSFLPEGYRQALAIKTVIDLPITPLVPQAKKLLAKPSVQKVIDLYYHMPDCRDLVASLVQTPSSNY